VSLGLIWPCARPDQIIKPAISWQSIDVIYLTMPTSSAAFIAGVLACKKRWSWKRRMLVCYLHSLQRRGESRRRRGFSLHVGRNICRNRGFAIEQMDRLDPSTFKRMFRVDRYTFEEILEKIMPFLDEKNDQKAINSSGSAITNKT
jgi:hypothetical protein